MSITAAQVLDAAERWGLEAVASPVVESLAAYGNLLLRWNARLSLTAIRDEDELIERHLMEGVFAAANHPSADSALDFGSGTGIPGIPIALCRQDIAVTLAESQKKKAAFLQEAVRLLGMRIQVYADRAEGLTPGGFRVVWMRAVDKSARMTPVAANLVAPEGHLCLLSTAAPPETNSLATWSWHVLPFPGSAARVLHIGTRN